MIVLTWDWGIALGIVLSGVLAGYFVVPLAWPERTALHIKPPAVPMLSVWLSTWATFFGSLAVYRYLSGITVELQATVLYLIFVFAATAGTRLRR